MSEQDIQITLLGDIFPGELHFTKNYGIRSQFERHNGVPWVDKLRRIIGDADLVIGNLESPLVEKEQTVKDTFFGNPEFAKFLKTCGVNVLNVANNHILEQNEYGFDRTLDILTSNELSCVGNVVNGSSKILYKIIKGRKVAIAGFSNVDLHKIMNNSNFAVLNEFNVLSTIEVMKQGKADVKILCFHWGDEYVKFPSFEQRKLAYGFLDAGVDIIAGHHPHVIQPYEKYKDGHVFYSLGNFMFDYIHSKSFSIGLVAKLNIGFDHKKVVRLHGVKLSYRNTVSEISEKEFLAYNTKISNLYSKISVLDKYRYETKYDAMLRRNNFAQRVLMKMSLFKEFFRVKSRDKWNLINNVLKYYFHLNRQS